MRWLSHVNTEARFGTGYRDIGLSWVALRCIASRRLVFRLVIPKRYPSHATGKVVRCAATRSYDEF